MFHIISKYFILFNNRTTCKLSRAFDKGFSYMFFLFVLYSSMDKHKESYIEKVLINKHMNKILLKKTFKRAETIFICSSVQLLSDIMSNKIRRKFVGNLSRFSEIGNYRRITDQPKRLIFRHNLRIDGNET